VEANPRTAHALAPDGGRIDPVFARLLDIAAPAATCHPDLPLTALPASPPGFYANQLTAPGSPASTTRSCRSGRLRELRGFWVLQGAPGTPGRS
jgi:hypothetical protein